MKRSHSFRSRSICKKTSAIVDVLCVFFGRAPTDITVLTDEIQNCLKTKEPIPDVIYVLGSGSIISSITKLWCDHPAQAAIVLERGNPPGIVAIKDFSILAFGSGTFSPRFSKSTSIAYDLDLRAIIRDGLASLVDATGAYQTAPPGHVFSHPSGKRSKNFFLANELLRNEIDVYFVAMCVCVNAWDSILGSKRIYIDTMGIYPIAKAIGEIMEESGQSNASSMEIENFHSHVGLDEFQPVPSETDLVLISASTSGGLARKLDCEKHFSPKKIITLLDAKKTDRIGVVIHSNDDHASEVDRFSSTFVISHDTPIELAGEYFVAQGKKPRALTLTVAHAPMVLASILNTFNSSDSCSLNRIRKDSSTIDSVSIDKKSIYENENFLKWLRSEIDLRAPASISHVIPLDGEASLPMAEICAARLGELKGINPKILSTEQLSEQPGDKITGVIVCALLVGNGHAMRLVSRGLREICPKASRHFIVGVGLPDSQESWDRLRQFLVQSGDRARPYLFSTWKQLAIGRKSPHDSWQQYSLLMGKLEHVGYKEADGWNDANVQRALNAAADLLEKSSSVLLPTTNQAALLLTDGFVYWAPPKDIVLAQINHAAVSYIAITSALQNAREFPEAAKRLKSSLHETVVIDPENFLRFNDGVLQACLLRAAYPHELDYSANLECSQSMREILEKILLNHETHYGEAALEFAAALAAGQIKLAKVDSIELFKKLRVIGTRSDALAGFLYSWWVDIQ